MAGQKVRSFRGRAARRAAGGVTIPLPFDPAEAWGRRDRYHVTGTIEGLALLDDPCGLVMHNADFRARFQALTQRKQNKLCKKAAYMAIANKLLRTLWHMAVTDQAYDSAIACGERRPDVVAA